MNEEKKHFTIYGYDFFDRETGTTFVIELGIN